MPRRTTLADLSPKEFRDALVDRGFAYLGPIDRFVDIRSTVRGRYLPAIKGENGKIDRRKTLKSLLDARSLLHAAQAIVQAEQRRRQEIAGRIAPKVVPACRADLKAAAAVAQLADDYLERVASAGAVEFKALIQMGWSADQLREHGDAARAVADRRAVPA